MSISEQSILFFVIMILYVIYTTPLQLSETLIIKLLTVGVITFCIQYLSIVNLPIISWIITFIPIIYILSIIVIQYLFTI